MLGVAGRFAAPVPLAETLLAGWLLAPPASPRRRPMTFAPAGRATASSSTGRHLERPRVGVPLRAIQHLAVLAYRGNERVVALVETKDCRLADGRNLAGDASMS